MDPESSQDLSVFAEEMKKFYREKGNHDFRWRMEEATPYEVLMAVIFLQRTGRKQVADVFKDFISRFPDPAALSESDLGGVESVMEPLGLHWRAKNVHKIGTVLTEEFGGNVPDDESIFKLPGVGTYVGNMVLCLAFDRRTAPVDANVGRILNRVFGLGRENAPRRYGRDKVILDLAERCLPSEGYREYNLGLLDFGNKVCRFQNPRCESCPLISECSEQF